MNILVVNHYSGSPQHGMEYRHFYLANEWAELGHKVCIIAASYSHLRRKQPEIKGVLKKELVNGIPYIWIKTPVYSQNGTMRALNILIFSFLLFFLKKQILGIFKPDVVVVSSPHPLAIFGSKRLAMSVNAKLVYEVRDIWPLTLTELGGISPGHPFIRLMQYAENFAYRFSDHLISLLPKLDGYLAKKGFKTRFHYVPNGIKTSEWKSDGCEPVAAMEKLSNIKKKGKMLIGYAGAHGQANELQLLIETAALMQEYPAVFVFIGDGPEKPRLVKSVEDKRLQNIIFFDPVTKKDITKFLNLMDILYIGLQKKDIFRFGISPNKLMDYMMSAKPVIQAINAGNDIVAECNCGISITDGSPHAVKDAIVTIMNMTETQRAAMGLRGRNYVMENHDYKVLAKSFLSAFSETGQWKKDF